MKELQWIQSGGILFRTITLNFLNFKSKYIKVPSFTRFVWGF